MTDLKFKINNKVEIIDDQGGIYNSDIQDVSKDSIAISIPIKDSAYLPLRKNDIIDVLYYDGNNIYSFSSSIKTRTNSNIPLIWIHNPKRYKKIQRRKFVRVSVLLKGLFAKVDRTMQLTNETIKTLKFSKCNIVDLSGGGIKIRTREELEEGTILALILPINEKNMIVKAEVKRSGEKSLDHNEYGIGFIDISVKQQDEIIKNVFAIMRQQMRKGLKEE
ncbi:flagellar protein [Clostridium novyi A str. 4552]|uniref:Flagellar protein n=1 Tax=Clostridium novyi A str. 4552 TaxID=1444289 RepID=A0A0A0IAP7_CLONO|nr:flagellar brake domain-containing protein [Clostridium novyi]KGM97391.1 flagellar protein [Clostridium novyi A str. 4552]